jgi:diacylglycerol kinase family enzyme
MRQRALVLLNRSSHRADADVRARVEELLRSAPVDASIEQLSGHGLAAAASRAVAAGYTMLVAAGGDGTVSSVASVAAAHGIVFGVIPLGNMNHFARDAGIPLDLEAAVAGLACGRVVPVDVGEVNGRAFLNNSSLGLYPRLVWEREQQQRRGRRKPIALALAALRVWREYRHISVTIKGRSYRRNVRTPFVFVGNNEYAIDGGRIDARASLHDGCLQLCMAPNADRRLMARIVFAAIAGRLRTVDGFERVLASELTIAMPSRRVGVSLDGELRILESPLHYRTRPRALRVIVPAHEGAG